MAIAHKHGLAFARLQAACDKVAPCPTGEARKELGSIGPGKVAVSPTSKGGEGLSTN